MILSRSLSLAWNEKKFITTISLDCNFLAFQLTNECWPGKREKRKSQSRWCLCSRVVFAAENSFCFNLTHLSSKRLSVTSKTFHASITQCNHCHQLYIITRQLLNFSSDTINVHTKKLEQKFPAVTNFLWNIQEFSEYSSHNQSTSNMRI